MELGQGENPPPVQEPDHLPACGVRVGAVTLVSGAILETGGSRPKRYLGALVVVHTVLFSQV